MLLFIHLVMSLVVIRSWLSHDLFGVEKALNRLNPSKATGPDKVPVRILKETANYHRTYSYKKLSTVDQHRPNTRGLVF
jgi:hypothetical protein